MEAYSAEDLCTAVFQNDEKATKQNEGDEEKKVSEESDDEFFELASDNGLDSLESFSVNDKIMKSPTFLQLTSQSTRFLPRIASQCDKPKSSSQSPAIKQSQSKKLPKPGPLQLYLRKKKEFESKNEETSPPDELSAKNPVSNASLCDQIESLTGQVNFHSSKANESKERAVKLSKTVDQLRLKLSEAEKKLRVKDSQLKEKNERKKVSENTLKQQRVKIKELQDQVTNLKKSYIELQADIEAKNESNLKLKLKVESLKRESKLMLMSNESLVMELNSVPSKTAKNQLKKKDTELVQKVENLEIELNSRDLQIDILKLEMDRLVEQNLQNLEVAKITDNRSETSDVVKLNNEIFCLKNNEMKLKDELRSLISELEQQQNQSSPNERLMQLRGKFVMTIQDQSKADNARLVLQVKNMEKIDEEDEQDLDF